MENWKIVMEEILDVDSGEVVKAYPYVLDVDGTVLDELHDELAAELGLDEETLKKLCP